MDLGELWKAVQGLLDEDRVDVPWGHIIAQGHRVIEMEIRNTLSDGTYSLHEDVDGRYVATWAEKRSRFATVVVFELWEARRDRRLLVLTAYHSKATGGGKRRR